MKPWKIAQFGFGSLGMEICKVLQNRKDFKIVGVIDTDPNKEGQDAGTLALGKKIGLTVKSKIVQVKPKPSIAIHTTTSSLKDAYNQISEIITHRINVISTCEQLVYPYGTNAKLAKKLDSLAKKYKVSVLGVGVNPGFIMDALVLMLTSLCSRIESIRVERVADLAKRRKSLQKKMCLGFTAEEFERVKRQVGHIGLNESAMMICNSLNAKGLTFDTTVRPVVANRSITSNDISLQAGQVAGIEHRLVAKKGKVRFLEMILYIFAGASEFDLVEIEGTPPVSVKTNGICGDAATIALLLNYIPIMVAAKPGLHTVNDLHIPHASQFVEVKQLK